MMTDLKDIVYYGIGFLVLSLVTSIISAQLLCRILVDTDITIAIGAIIGFMIPSVFMVPVLLALFGGNKLFCNRYCGRGLLLAKLGGEWKWSRNRATQELLVAKWFRFGFLCFFMAMFGNMLWQTYLVATQAQSLREVVTLLWTFKVPWAWAYTAGSSSAWVAQYAFGFYSVMLTSMLLGLVVMALFKPRTWCTFCPMGTMTQMICKMKK